IQDPEQRRWIQERVEQPHVKPPREEQLRILLKLNQAEAFETFLQTKFVGKSYSQIFREFEGNIDPRTVQGSGDVKYHLGAEGEFTAGTGAHIKVSVAANP